MDLSSPKRSRTVPIAQSMTHAASRPSAVAPAPPGPVVGTLAPILLGWSLVAVLIARRAGLFRKATITGPLRVGDDETVWLPTFLFFAAIAIAGLLSPLLLRELHPKPSLVPYVQLHLSELIAVAMIFVAMAIFRANGLRRLGISAAQLPIGILRGVALILVLFPLVSIVGELTSLGLRLAGEPQPKPHQVLQALHSSHDPKLIVLATAAAIFTAPIYEELIFRGCAQTGFSYAFEWFFKKIRPRPLANPSLQGELAPTVPPAFYPGVAARWCAILLAAALFAAVHGVWAFVPPLFVLAVGLGYCYEKTGNLWINITAHALFNTLQILIFTAAR